MKSLYNYTYDSLGLDRNVLPVLARIVEAAEESLRAREKGTELSASLLALQAFRTQLGEAVLQLNAQSEKGVKP